MKFVTIDIDQSKDLATKYNIKSIPTFIIIKNNKEINRFTGGDIQNMIYQFDQY